MVKFFLEHIDMGVAAIAAVLVLSLFMNFQDGKGNTGVLNSAGAIVDSSGQDFTDNAEREALQSLSGTSKPVFSSSNGTYQVNVSYIIGNYISAKDAADNPVQISVESIKRRTGDDVTHLYDRSSGAVTFDKPGIYDVVVCAIDANNRKSRQKVSFVVNG